MPPQRKTPGVRPRTPASTPTAGTRPVAPPSPSQKEVELPDRVLSVIARSVYEIERTGELAYEGGTEDPSDDGIPWGRLSVPDRNPYTRLAWDVAVRGFGITAAWERHRAWSEPFSSPREEEEVRARFRERFYTAKAVSAVVVARYQESLRLGLARARKVRRRTVIS